MESVANSSCTRSQPDILAIIKFDPYRLRNKANIYQTAIRDLRGVATT